MRPFFSPEISIDSPSSEPISKSLGTVNEKVPVAVDIFVGAGVGVAVDSVGTSSVIVSGVSIADDVASSSVGEVEVAADDSSSISVVDDTASTSAVDDSPSTSAVVCNSSDAVDADEATVEVCALVSRERISADMGATVRYGGSDA